MDHSDTKNSLSLSLNNITMYLKELRNFFHKTSSMIAAQCTSHFLAACKVGVVYKLHLNCLVHFDKDKI